MTNNLTNPNELQLESFKTLYYEDYINIQEEANELLRLAEEHKANGESINYRLAMNKYKVYQQTLDTLMGLLLKNPKVEA
tara:strand:- start:92 stop:331 length:240 start_codon:yes stop_codon:yes gene_type:complete